MKHGKSKIMRAYCLVATAIAVTASSIDDIFNQVFGEAEHQPIPESPGTPSYVPGTPLASTPAVAQEDSRTLDDEFFASLFSDDLVGVPHQSAGSVGSSPAYSVSSLGSRSRSNSGDMFSGLGLPGLYGSDSSAFDLAKRPRHDDWDFYGSAAPAEKTFKRLGFENRGENNCFFNSALQALIRLPEFRQFPAPAENENELITILRELLSEVYPVPVANPMRPLRLREYFARRFPVGAQQDVDEFLMEMMDALEKAGLFREAKFDVIRRGTCSTCLRPSTPATEADWKVSGFFPEGAADDEVMDLKDMIDRGFSNERVDGYECSGCKRRDVLQRVGQIVKAPRVLMVHLLRFTSGNSKIFNAVQVPLTGFEYAGETYRLHAVINHVGRSSRAGHYTATVYDTDSKTWIKYDDSTTHEVEADHVITEKAYYLIFVAEDQPVKDQ